MPQRLCTQETHAKKVSILNEFGNKVPKFQSSKVNVGTALDMGVPLSCCVAQKIAFLVLNEGATMAPSELVTNE
jgi:hypothetical protein